MGDEFQTEAVDDLLVRGEAAAQAGDKDEARFYLEWVLRAEPDLDQEARANYALSLVADDAAAKRSCLENVLAIYPNHAEARRDLAILDGRLKPEEVLDFRAPASVIAPSGSVNAGAVGVYRCPKCGGALRFSPEHAGLYCQFCGYTGAQASGKPEGVPQQDWEAAIYTKRGHSWLLPMSRSVSCQSCGAVYTLPPSGISSECPFCGAPQVVAQEDSRELIEPSGVLAFVIDAGAALGYARAWLKGARFTPADLDEKATFSLPRGAYLPFWAFDISGEMEWSGVVYKRELGQTITVPTTGSWPALFTDLTVAASKTLPAELLDSLSFDMSALVLYTPDLLADWPAEVYSISLSDGAVLAHEKAFKALQEELTGSVNLDAGGSVHELRTGETNIAITSFKLVLLPVWLTEYVYDGTQYRVVVNGQSGEVKGDIPRGKFQSFLEHLC